MSALPKRNVLVRFGDAVKQLRNRLGISQEELAGRAGLHRTYVADIERGARNLSLGSIEKLATALEISLPILFAHAGNVSRTLDRLHSFAPDHLVEILLVEDNPRDVELTMQAFKRVRFQNTIHVIRDGAAALEYLLGPHSPNPDALRPSPGLILLDLNLPKVNGTEVLRRLKADERTRAIPVIVLTVSQRSRDMIECQSLGVESYLMKPVGFQNFSQITPKLSLHWALLRPAPSSPA